MKKTLTNIVKTHYPEKLRENTEKLLGRQVYHPKFDEHQCVFIHIPKNAGTSIGEALFNCGTTGHWKANAYYWSNPQKYSTYFKFAFVRNPWDRLVSAYYYLQQGGKNLSDQKWAEKNLARHQTFSSFVDNWLSKDNIYTWGHFVPQHEFITVSNLDIQLDYIGRYENISEDFKKVAERLNIKNTLTMTNTSKHPEYKKAYTVRTQRKVEQLYEKDIEILNYSFGN